MSDIFTLLDLEQGSDEWLSWRRGGIGASDAPTIMGENPWKTREELLDAKRNPSSGKRARMTRAMARGHKLEPIARAAYSITRGLEIQPVCMQSNTHNWMRASLDGICLETMQAVEIKCGEASYKRSARSLRVPTYYYGQLQHTLAVSGAPEMDYYCYLPDRQPILLKVARDEEYIARLIDAGSAFWKEVCA